MRIIEKDKEGVTLVPEALNDLWYLYTHLEGKEIWQKTLRTKTICKSGEVIKGGKKPCYLGIKAEKIRWEYNILRVTGIITEGEERNKHHSIEIELNEKLKVVGDMSEIPKEAKREVFVCVVDRNEAIITWLRGRNFGPLEIIKAGGREEEYYKEVSSRLKRENAPYLLIAGHDTAKNKISNHLEAKPDQSIFFDQLSTAGKDGLEEIVKRAIVKQIFEKQREDAERKIITETLACVKKNPEKAMYGESLQNETERVKEILVLNNFVAKHEAFLKEAEKKGLKIDVVDASKDYSRELKEFEIVGVCWY